MRSRKESRKEKTGCSKVCKSVKSRATKPRRRSFRRLDWVYCIKTIKEGGFELLSQNINRNSSSARLIIMNGNKKTQRMEGREKYVRNGRCDGIHPAETGDESYSGNGTSPGKRRDSDFVREGTNTKKGFKKQRLGKILKGVHTE